MANCSECSHTSSASVPPICQEFLYLHEKVKCFVNMKLPQDRKMLTVFCRVQSKTHVGSSRRMKNPEKLAASKKKPLVARYILGNRVIVTRDPTYVPEYAT